MSADHFFEEHRRYLTGICYRMLGTIADAEDVVQDAYLRWHNSGQPELDNPRAWFTRVCTRICLDRIKSLNAKRDQYPGPWLPEPMVDPAVRLEVDESISIALLLAVQQLSPKERATFILHDVFGFSFDEVAETLELTNSSCRQLAVRARAKLRERHSRRSVDTEEMGRLTQAFFRAVDAGDIEGLKQVLSEDVVLLSDGGGKVPAVSRPIVGREAVHRFLAGIFRMKKSDREYQLHDTWFNGGPAVVVSSPGADPSAFQFSIDSGRIRSIYVQRNPEKLRHLNIADS